MGSERPQWCDIMKTIVESLLNQTQAALSGLDTSVITSAIETITQCAERGGTVWLFGNGGSASTASHFAADLAKWGSPPGVCPVHATCLSDNLTLLTSLVNDVGWDAVYSYQLERGASDGDVAIAISVHGGIGQETADLWSQNLIRGLLTAKTLGCSTVGLSGFDGGSFGDVCDIHINVTAQSTPVVESVHVLVAHCIADGLRQRAVEYR